MFLTFLYWLPALCVVLHVIEEFGWPGGFIEWYRRYRPDLAPSITVRFVLIVNSLLLLFTLLLGAFGPTSSRGPSALLSLAAALARNGVFHLRGMVRSHEYSPGVVTGSLLYLPLCLGAFWWFFAAGGSLQIALVSFTVGLAYQFWSASNHRRRSAAAAP